MFGKGVSAIASADPRLFTRGSFFPMPRALAVRRLSDALVEAAAHDQPQFLWKAYETLPALRGCMMRDDFAKLTAKLLAMTTDVSPSRFYDIPFIAIVTAMGNIRYHAGIEIPPEITERVRARCREMLVVRNLEKSLAVTTAIATLGFLSDPVPRPEVELSADPAVRRLVAEVPRNARDLETLVRVCFTPKPELDWTIPAFERACHYRCKLGYGMMQTPASLLHLPGKHAFVTVGFLRKSGDYETHLFSKAAVGKGPMHRRQSGKPGADHIGIAIAKELTNGLPPAGIEFAASIGDCVLDFHPETMCPLLRHPFAASSIISALTKMPERTVFKASPAYWHQAGTKMVKFAGDTGITPLKVTCAKLMLQALAKRHRDAHPVVAGLHDGLASESVQAVIDRIRVTMKGRQGSSITPACVVEMIQIPEIRAMGLELLEFICHGNEQNEAIPFEEWDMVSAGIVVHHADTATEGLGAEVRRIVGDEALDTLRSDLSRMMKIDVGA